MATLTFDRVLASAESLPADEQAMLEELLHRRRIENWRNETAAEAVVAVKAFRSGKLEVRVRRRHHCPSARGQVRMRELVLTSRFERAFRRLTAKNPALQSQIETALQRMAENIADPRLKTHRLSGQLAGLHACSVAYDCRIVFSKQKHPKTGAETLLLINIGTHEEVY